ncbi:MAG: hypothetical protein QXU18_14705 [Thermoplasmatales archaeon]
MSSLPEGDSRNARPISSEAVRFSSWDLYRFWNASTTGTRIGGDDKGQSISPLSKYKLLVDFSDKSISSLLFKYHKEVQKGLTGCEKKTSKSKDR